MFSFNFVRWLHRLARPRRQTINKRSPRFRLNFELLEDRVTPATFVWDGGGGDNNWSTAANWVGDVAPGSVTGPAGNAFLADVSFGIQGAGKLTANNDIPGLVLNSISVAGVNNYNLTASTGIQTILGDPSLASSGFINVGTNLDGARIALDLHLASTGGGQQFITVGTGSDLTISGKISGTTGAQLSKTGGVNAAGDLFLTGDNRGFSGQFTLQADAGIVNVGNPRALGSTLTSTVETLTLNNPTTATKFQLSFGASSTGVLSYTGTTADAAAVQAALNALPSITSQFGSVVVSQTNTASSVTFTIVFTGNFAGTNVTTPINGNVTVAPGSFSAPVLSAGGTNPYYTLASPSSPFQVVVSNNSTLQLNSVSPPITNASQAGSTVTINTASAHNLTVGQLVTITGVRVAGYNGTFQVQSVIGPNAFTVTNGITGLATVANSGNIHPIANTIQLFGQGVNGDSGSLVNVAGTTVLTGSVNLASNGLIGVQAGVLNIAGVISDSGSGHSLTKIGQPSSPTAGELILSNANTYRGSTTVQNGLLTIQHPLALGSVPSAGTFVINNNNGPQRGTLQIQDPTGVGFTVQDVVLTLQGSGFGVGGALINLQGNNTWTGRVVLDNSFGAVLVNTAANTSLNLKGVIQDLAGATVLNKNGAGNLIVQPTSTLTGNGTPNIYTGATNIQQGTLTLRDSQGLGLQTKTAMTTVSSGAALVLESNVGHVDSITGLTNKLQVASPLTISGQGFGGNTGALRSISGINTYTVVAPNTAPIIRLAGNASIGVDAEPTQTASNAYFTNDYSLTINGGLDIDGSETLTKVMTGHLILPNPNASFFGTVVIRQGWITIQDRDALGSPTNLVQEAKPTHVVESGAALHFKPNLAGTSFTFPQNLILQGMGITHPFAAINQKGAVENLGGINTIEGNIQLIGQTGIGVEKVDPAVPSDLTLRGQQSARNPAASFALPVVFATGGAPQYSQIVDTGSIKGTLSIAYTGATSTNIKVYNGPIGTAGSTLLVNTTVSGAGTLPLLSYTGTGTNLQIVVNDGVYAAGDTWTYTATVNPDLTGSNVQGGIVKVGSQRLNLRGAGTFTGGVDIKEGVIRVMNENALGAMTNNVGTTVQTGAALELDTLPSAVNGGLPVGPSIWGVPLTLNGTGNATFGSAPLTVLAKDNLWTGDITLRSNISIAFEGMLANTPINAMTAIFRNAPAGTVDPAALTLTGSTPSIDVASTTLGGGGLNAVQMLTFGGSITGGTFQLRWFDGITTHTTGNISWNTDPNLLLDNIRAALAPIFGAGNFNVSITNPGINVLPNARLVVSGVVSDGDVPVASPLIHNYVLSGASRSLNDTVGSTPLVGVGGTLGAAGYTWAAVTGANQGLTLTGAVPDPGNYSIGMQFSFTTVPTSYNRILDFKNRVTDTGLYSLNTALNFYGSINGLATVFAPNVPVNLLVTRDSSTNVFTAYINGVQQFTFVDSTGDAVISAASILNFFIDDTQVANEVSGGTVTGIQIYNRPLTAGEVLDVLGGSNLGVQGATTIVPGDLTVSGGGEVVLTNANTFRGTAIVTEGTLTIQNAQALGSTDVPGRQELILTGAVPGTTQFTLTYNGVTSAPITYLGTAADATNIQNALTAILPAGGTVRVLQNNAGVFLFTFGGTLASTATLTSARIVTGFGTAVVAPQGGTLIANDAQLQMAGGVTVAGESLVLEGDGSNQVSTVQTFTVGTSSVPQTGTFTLNFNGASTPAIPYNATAAQIQALVQNLTTVKDVGGRVSVIETSQNAGNNERQSFTFTGFTVGQQYTLTFGSGPGSTTSTLSYTGVPQQERAQIRQALNALTTIGSVAISGALDPAPMGFVQGGIFVSLNFSGGLGNSDQPMIQANLVGAPGGRSLVVAEEVKGSAASRTFQVVFNGTFAGELQPLLTAPLVTGSTVVAAPTYVIRGGSANETPFQWFNVGPAPISNAQVFNGTGFPAQNQIGRVVGVTVHPQFSNDITIATAGGGFWTTKDGGVHWEQVLDAHSDDVFGDNMTFGGAVATFATPGNAGGSPDSYYYAGGEGNNSTDSFYGTGVYFNRRLLTDPVLGNPFVGLAINKILVDPGTNDNFRIWVAASDRAADGVTGSAGIWRYDGVNWVNLTAATFPTTDVSYTDLAMDGAGRLYASMYKRSPLNLNNPGPLNVAAGTGLPAGAYHYEVTAVLPSGESVPSNIQRIAVNGDQFVTLSWSAVAGATSYRVYRTSATTAANGADFTAAGGVFLGATGITTMIDSNITGTAGAPPLLTSDVLVSLNPRTAGTFNATNIAKFIPPGSSQQGVASWTIGNIKLTTSAIGVFAALTNAFNAQNTLAIMQTNNAGTTWFPIYSTNTRNLGPGLPTGLPAAQTMSIIPDYLNNQGNYASAIVGWTDDHNNANAGDDTSHLFVGGVDQGSGTNFVLWLVQDTPTSQWSAPIDISKDASNIGPHTLVHSIAFDSFVSTTSGTPLRGRNIVVGTDGGVWKATLNYTNRSVVWTNINGDLAISSLTAVSTKPGEPGVILASGHNLGSFISSPNTQTWESIPSLGGGTSSNGLIQFVPTNKNVAYAVNGSGSIFRSTNGGLTFSQLTGIFNGVGFSVTGSTFALDPSNPNRIVTPTRQTIDGTNYITLGATPFTPTRIALAQLQGAYVEDPSFAGIPIFEANHYDGNTLYITSGSSFAVTKNGGTNWVTRNIPGINGHQITGLVVDPTNRDTAYVTVGGFIGDAANPVPNTDRVYKTTDAGRTWTDISEGLPDAPAYTLVLDPRTNDLYVGGDMGIWRLSGGVGAWQEFGNGLPNTQVRFLELNTATNVLTAATYGRGVWQYYIGDTTPNAGAFRALAGNNVWNGPVVLNGATTISANGSVALQAGLAGAQLTIQGSISDTTTLNTSTADFAIPAVGNSATINVASTTGVSVGQSVFITDNVRSIAASVTAIGTGTLTIQVSNILQGSVSAIMNSGATVALATSTTAGTGSFTIPAFGSTAVLSVGSTTGFEVGRALYISDGARAINAAITDVNATLGTITIQTSVLLQGSAGTTMNAGAVVASTGNTLVKVGGGDVILQAGNTYAGVTDVREGNLIVAHPNALGSSRAGTLVESGAALQLKSSLQFEPVTVYGSGLLPPYNSHFTGPFRSVVNNNTYTGPLTLGNSIAIGVDANTLTIVSPVVQNAITGAGAGSLTPGATYYYVVSAVVNGVETVASNEQSFLASAGNGAVNLSWNAVTGATGYRVYRSTLSGSYAASSLIFSGAATGFLDSGAAATTGAPARLHSITGAGFGINKEGAGNLVLASANSYGNATVGTIVDRGILTVRDARALGVPATATTTSGTFTVAPVDNTTVTVNLTSAAGFSVGQAVIIGDGLSTITGTVLAVNSGANTIDIRTSVIHRGQAGNIMATGAPVAIAITTLVRDGTQLQLQSDVAGAAISVQGQKLVLSGTGTATNGVLANVAGNNTWAGNILLSSVPAFATTSTPGGVVAINVASGTTLTLAGTISEGPPPAQPGTPAVATTDVILSGLAQVGTGTLTLAGNNTYTGGTYIGYTFGVTYVPGGVINLQNSGALGLNQGKAIQRLTTFDPTNASDTYTLSFGSGSAAQTTTTAITAGASAAQVQVALNNVPTIVAAGGVTVTKSTIYAGINEVQTLTLDNVSGSFATPILAPATITAGGSLATGATYHYVVTAITAHGETIISNEVNTGAIVAGSQTANLSWTNTSVEGAIGYRVYRSTTAGSYTHALIATINNVATTSYTDTGADLPPLQDVLTMTSGGFLDIGSTYFYVVTAVLPGGETPISNQVSTGVVTVANRTANLSWNAVPGALSYRVYRSTTSGSFASTRLANVTTTSYADNGALVGTNSPPASPPQQTRLTLTYNGQPAVPTSILYTGNPVADRANIEAELNNANIVGTGGVINVAVDASGTVFTITFAGTMSVSGRVPIVAQVTQSDASAVISELVPGTGGVSHVYNIQFNAVPAAGAQPLITVTTSSAALTTQVTEVATGGVSTLVNAGTTLQIDGGAAGITIPSNNILSLSGAGLGGVGALVNASGTNTWQGPVVLKASSTVAAQAGTQLSITGTVQDSMPSVANPLPSPVPPASLTKIGDGAIALAPTAQTLTFTNLTGAGHPAPAAPALALQSSATGVPNGNKFYVVTALTPEGETLASAEATINVVAGSRHVQLTWASTPGAFGYRIYRSTISNNYANSFVATVTAAAGGTQTYLDTAASTSAGAPPTTTASVPVQNAPLLLQQGSLTVAQPYFYVVTAVTAVGETRISNERTVTPTAGNQSVLLSWNATAGAIGYKIYRSTTSNSYTSPALVTTLLGATSLSYTDTGSAATAGAPPVATQFTLTFNSVTTAPITYMGNDPTGDAAAIAAALNAILLPGQSVAVTADATGSIFTFTFGGTLAGTTSPVTATITQGGAGQSTAFKGNTYTGDNFVQAGALNIQHAKGLGVNRSALQNVSVVGSSGSFTLAFSKRPDTTSLTSAVLVAGGSLAVNQNHYYVVTAVTPEGETFISNERFVLAPVPGNQTARLTWTAVTGATSYNVYRSSVSGIYAGSALVANVAGLTYDDVGNATTLGSPTTALIPVGASAATVQNALNALSNISANGGSVTVTQTGTTYHIYFNTPVGAANPLAHVSQIPFVAAFTSGVSSVTVTPIQLGGASRTVVTSGASLQLQSPTGTGFTESSGKPLTINGLGINNQGALDNVSGNNRWTGSPVILGSNASIGSQNALAGNTLFIDNAISDSFAQQDLTFTGLAAGDFYRLNLGGYTTGLLTYSASAAANATNIAAALNALPNVALLGAGLFTGNVAAQSGNVYRVSFNGLLSNYSWAPIIGRIVSGSGTSITSAAAPTGTNSFSVTKLGDGTAQYSGAIANAYNGLTDVQAGTLELNKTGVNTAILGNVNVGTSTLVSEIQSINFTNFAVGDTYRLSFNGIETSPIVFNGSVDSVAIVNALNLLASLTGHSATVVSVNNTIVGGPAYTGSVEVRFTTGLANLNVPQISARIISSSGSLTTSTTREGGSSAVNADVVRLLQANQIADTSAVAVNADGLFNLNNLGETIGSLAITGGTTRTGASGGNAFNVTGAVTISNGAVNKPGSNGTLDIGGSAAALASIVNIGGGLTMTGGVVNLDGPSSQLNITGPLSSTLAAINLLGSSAALSANGAVTLTDSVVTLSGAGSAFNIASGNTLTLVGSTFDLAGAGSTVSLGGNVSATSTASTGTGTGTATFKGIGSLLLNGNRGLTVNHGGAATVTTDLLVAVPIVDGAVSPSGITVQTTSNPIGKVAFASDNTYTGATTINSGDLQLDFVQQLTLTGFTNGDTFRLNYTNGGVAVSSGPIVYSPTASVTASNIVTALANLLTTLFGLNGVDAAASIAIEIVSASVFKVTLLGRPGAALDVQAPTVVASAGTVNGTQVSNTANVALADTASTAPAASLSGKGLVGGVLTTGSDHGTIAPGSNGQATPDNTGILTIDGDATFNSNNTFVVDITNTSDSHPAPIAGADHDQLRVLGNVTLGNMLLLGLPTGPNIQLGDSYTILSATGTISGQFTSMSYGLPTPVAHGDSVFLNGQKFTVQYNANSVVLVRQSSTITAFDLLSSANPSVYGQDVTFLARVTPEAGASFTTSSATVTFVLDAGSHTRNVTINPALQEIEVSITAGTTFTLNYFNGTQFGTTAPIVWGGANAGTDAGAIQTALNNLLASIGVAGSVSVVPAAGSTTRFNATFAGASATNVYPLLGNSGSGTIRVSGLASYAPQSPGELNTVWSPTELPPALHVIQASFSDANNVFTAPPTQTINQDVNKNVVVITPSTSVPTIVYGQSIDISALVAPGALANLPAALSPGGTLRFAVDVASTPTTTSTTASFTVPAVGAPVTFSVASATGLAVNQYLRVTDGARSVLGKVTNVSGTNVTFTVDSILAGNVGDTMASGAAVGIARIYEAVNFIGAFPATLSARTATQTILGSELLPVGTHTVDITYNADDPNYAATTTPVTITFNVVADGTSLAFTPAPVSSFLGQNATFNVVVTGNLGGSPGDPQGVVQFFDGDPTAGGVLLNTNTTTSSSFVIPAVNASTTINVNSAAGLVAGQFLRISSGSTVFVATIDSVAGTSVTIRTTHVLSGAVGSTLAVGALVGVATQINPILGTASFTYPGLTLGAHNIYTVFTPINANYTAVTNSFTNFIVQRATTSTAIQTPLPSASYGEQSTFTVQVSASPSIDAVFPAIDPNATVTMYARTTTTTTSAATFVIPAVGAQVDIQVAASAGFAVGNRLYVTDGVNTLVATVDSLLTGPTALRVTVNQVITGAVGNTVATSASVHRVIVLGTSAVSGTGVATITTDATGPNALPTGNVPLIAVYNGDLNFGLSQDTSQTITVTGAIANTSVISVSPNSADHATTPVVLTAQVSSNVPGLPTGTGSYVTFYDGNPSAGGIAINPVPNSATINNAGVATFTVQAGSFTGGSHSIYAVYTDVSGSYVNGTNTPASLQITNGPTAVTSVISSVNPSTYGQNVTFTATVSVPAASRNNLASVTASGALDTFFNPGTGANGTVATSVVQADGKIIIGGSFTSYNGTARNRIARLNADGSLDTSFNPGTGANGQVVEAQVQADGKIVIVGGFTSYNGTARNFVARLNADGTLDTSFNPGAGASSGVEAVALQADGKVLIGGTFTSYDGTARTRIARLNTDGTLDTSFNPGLGADGGVAAIAVQTDGKILIGGYFSTYDGTGRNCIARLNTDGTLDTSFNPGNGANSQVLALALQSDGKVVIGGAFTFYDNTLRSRIARVNTDGTLDTTFNPGSGVNSPVLGLTVQSDGKVVISGDFTSYNATARNGVARVNADGSLDTTFASGLSSGAGVSTVALQPGGEIFLGGFFFTSYASSPANLPSGTVSFLDGTSVIGTGMIGVGGVATFSTTTLNTGSHSITARYEGDAGYATSTSSAITQNVNQASTTTGLVSSLNPSGFGNSVTFTATVAPVSPGSGTPTGTVEFFVNSVSIGTGTSQGSGVWSFTTSALIPGTHTITAQYLGSSNHAGSLSNNVSQEVIPGTTISLLSDTNPSGFGQNVTFTATISSVPSGSGTPTGSVEFFNGTTSLGTSPINGSGVATYSTSTLSVGTHTITAVYTANASYGGSTSNSVSQVVSAAGTTTAILSPTTAVYGADVTFTATVTASSSGTPPAGTLVFQDLTTGLTLGTGNPIASDGTSRTYDLSVSAAMFSQLGAHNIRATYTSGSANVANSIGNSTLTINPASTTTVLNPGTATNTQFGQTATFTVQVTALGSGIAPHGQVQFFENGNSIGFGFAASTSGSVSTFSITISTLSTGVHDITATYVGNAFFTTSSTSTGAEQEHTVYQATTQTSVASSAPTAVHGQVVTYTITVIATSGGPTVGVPNGTVDLYQNAILIAPGLTLNSAGQASYSKVLVVGEDNSVFSAVYGATTNYATSSSSGGGNATQDVINASTTTTVSSNPLYWAIGEDVTFMATVTQNSPSTLTPTGNVVFRFDENPFTDVVVALSGNTASYTLTGGFTGGPHSVRVIYSGTTGFDGSNTGDPADFGHGIAQHSGTLQDVRYRTNLSVNHNYDQSQGINVPITLTAQVTSPHSGNTISGTVDFYDNGNYIGTATVDPSTGLAVLAPFIFGQGVHSITAFYSGNTFFNPAIMLSPPSISFTVTRAFQGKTLV